jgi:hypothetical protein
MIFGTVPLLLSTNVTVPDKVGLGSTVGMTEFPTVAIFKTPQLGMPTINMACVDMPTLRAALFTKCPPFHSMRHQCQPSTKERLMIGNVLSLNSWTKFYLLFIYGFSHEANCIIRRWVVCLLFYLLSIYDSSP